MTSDQQTSSDSLASSVAEIGWYHTIELPGGVVTPGEVDCRGIVSKTLLPDRLDGKRVLDVGTWDGFWAFELERRGAEVTTIDVPGPDQLDWPPRARLGHGQGEWEELLSGTHLGQGFEIARRALGSSVVRERVSVYELTEADLGRFDLVFVGSILVHLRDPVRALDALGSVCDGPVVLNETLDLLPTVFSPRTARARFAGDNDLVLWWHSNLAGLRQIVRSAGFVEVRRSNLIFIPWGEGRERPSLGRALGLLRSAQGREFALTWLLGITHCCIECERLP